MMLCHAPTFLILAAVLAFSAKPSAGLEPATRSLPWRIGGMAARGGRKRCPTSFSCSEVVFAYPGSTCASSRPASAEAVEPAVPKTCPGASYVHGRVLEARTVVGAVSTVHNATADSPSAHFDLPDGTEVGWWTEECRPGRFRQEDRAAERLRQALDARGGVDGVAVHGVLEPPERADVPGHERSAVQADTHALPPRRARSSAATR